MRILVTAAAGKVGRQAVTQLLDEGVQVRALVRDPARAGLPEGAEVVRGDLTDAGSVEAALDGVDGVFLIWPLMTADAAPAVVKAIQNSGASRIAYLSAWGVPDDGSEPDDPILGFHTELERLVRGSGLAWTFLRSGGFASNALGWAEEISTGDTVRAPYAQATRSLIHEADLADVAVRSLTTDEHVGATYHLTGPEALTQAEQVRTIGEALGRELHFEEQSPAEAVASYVAYGLTQELAEGIIEAHGDMVANPEPVSPDFARVTGTPGRTFLEWARDHRADFGG